MFARIPFIRLTTLAALAVALGACPQKPSTPPGPPGTRQPPPAKLTTPPPWQRQPVLEPEQVYALHDGAAEVMTQAQAQAAGYQVIDLSDAWAPFIFSEQDVQGDDPKPQPYRQIFIDLSNDKVSPEVLYLRGDGPTKVIPAVPKWLSGKQRETFEEERDKRKQKDLDRLLAQPTNNFLEPYGIPPALSVLRKRIEEDSQRQACFAEVDRAALAAFEGNVTYQDMGLARREHQQAIDDAAWVKQQIDELEKAPPEGAPEPPVDAGTAEDKVAAADPAKAARVQRHRQGQARLAAVKAAQRRLVCEGLIRPGEKFTEGMFDLVTHEALALFERKNDIFSWGSLGGETLQALARAPMEQHFETFKRILTERVVDAAGIIEDESVALLGKQANYKDEGGQDRVVGNLVGAYRDTLLAAMGIESGDDVAKLLGTVSTDTFRVAFAASSKPPYYAGEMQLEAEIDRGDIWYDFPFDDAGKALVQQRRQYPHLTLFVRWNKQRIALSRWRTTIGSWRSERHPDGNVYYKYKNSDIGARIWKHIVVSPVWVPPDGTPPKDMLTLKKFNPFAKPEVVVNTDVVGPGFQSAYGLVMAIHHQVTSGGGLFDNQIRTHGSVDYTSIARRYSHGCHRLVNIRAVRLFGFVLQHTPFERVGDQKLGIKKRFAYENQTYEYLLGSRGYYYRLKQPVKVEVLEGRIMGNVDKPITAFVRKPGSPSDDPGPPSDDPVLPSDDAQVSEPTDVVEAEPPALLEQGLGEAEAAVPATVLPPVITPEQARAIRATKNKPRR